MVTTKNIGSEITSSDGVVGSKLNGGPPLRIEQNAIAEPIRDVLLANLPAAKLPHTGREVALGAPCSLDGALQGSNVLFLHRHPKYTNRLVNTTPFVLQEHKLDCIVLPMTAKNSRKTTTRQQQAKAERPKRQALPGADGKHLGQRLAEAMAYESGRRHREYRQIDLLDDANKLAGRSAENPLLTQQMLSAIMRGTVSRSTATPFLAVACHVNALWLSEGIGKMFD